MGILGVTGGRLRLGEHLVEFLLGAPHASRTWLETATAIAALWTVGPWASWPVFRINQIPARGAGVALCLGHLPEPPTLVPVLKVVGPGAVVSVAHLLPDALAARVEADDEPATARQIAVDAEGGQPRLVPRRTALYLLVLPAMLCHGVHHTTGAPSGIVGQGPQGSRVGGCVRERIRRQGDGGRHAGARYYVVPATPIVRGVGLITQSLYISYGIASGDFLISHCRLLISPTVISPADRGPHKLAWPTLASSTCPMISFFLILPPYMSLSQKSPAHFLVVIDVTIAVSVDCMRCEP